MRACTGRPMSPNSSPSAFPAAQPSQARARTAGPPPAWRLWCGVLILAACETHWLYGALPGLNRALTALIVTVGIALARRAAGKGRGYGVVTALGCACLIGAAAAVTADPAYELLIAAAVLFALGAALMADYAAGRALRGPLSWVLAAPAAAPLAAAEAGSRFTEAAVLLRAGSSLAVLRGIALALPVTAFLALLLSQADPT